ncbi:hypothetical protein Poli38472_002374 [Pythium oligandrum]|uniref:Glutathione S-transferase n=1 Tax=Pythium oligandrum TaxID=41045 RepID=A0A8K1FM90_PYTOL|nr:hypothetical protein Poli38472_002374 [Pythium oligandrum]|eukprot:TMW63433.1 hypothetical protein Poli38472_002374 [Pythium oligandrum]
MTHPELKITYFPITARGDFPRLALVYAGLDLQDERIAFADWGQRKTTLPLGQLPQLSVNNEVYVQSMGIARYAGRLGGLYPADSPAVLKVDSVLDTLLEVTNKFIDIYFHTQGTGRQTKKIIQATEELFPKVFDYVESHNQGKFVLGDQISLADISVFDEVTNTMADGFPEFSLAPYPKVQAIVEAIKRSPRIATYLAMHT